MSLLRHSIAKLIVISFIAAALAFGCAKFAAAFLVKHPVPVAFKDADDRIDEEDLSPGNLDKLCGPKAVATAAMLQGIRFDLGSFLEICPIGPEGARMLDLKDTLAKLHIQSEGKILSWDGLVRLGKPAVLFVSGNHYVTVDPRDLAELDKGSSIRFYNPPKVASFISEAELKECWKGEALLLERDEAAAPNNQPRIEFDRFLQDFGARKVENQAECDFVFRNRGSAPLSILEVAKTCGCTTAAAYPREILPGESGTVHVAMELGGKAGAQKQVVTVRTNDPDNPTVELVFQGFAKRDLYANRNSLVFLHLTRGSEASDQVLIQSRLSQSLRVKRVEVLPNESGSLEDIGYEAAVVAAPKDFDSSFPTQFVSVRVKAKESARFGEHIANLSIELEGGDADYLLIPIQAVVVPAIAFEPSNISLGIVKPGSTAARVIALRGEGAQIKEPAIFKATSNRPDDTATLPKIELDRIENGVRFYRVSLAIPAGESIAGPAAVSGDLKMISESGETGVKWSYIRKPSD